MSQGWCLFKQFIVNLLYKCFFNYTQVFSSLQTFMFWGSNVQIWHLFPLSRRTGSPTLRWNLQIKKIFYYMCCVTSRTTGLTLWNTIFSPASKCHHSILQHTGFINEPELIHRDQWSLGKNKNSSQMFNSCNTRTQNPPIPRLKTKKHMSIAEYKQNNKTAVKVNWQPRFDWCAMMITFDICWWKTETFW